MMGTGIRRRQISQEYWTLTKNLLFGTRRGGRFKMHKLILRAGILLLATTVGVTLRAQDSDTQTLKGIQGLGVVVEDINSEAERAGLHRTDIQTDVELKLRLAGIKVLSDEAM